MGVVNDQVHLGSRWAGGKMFVENTKYWRFFPREIKNEQLLTTPVSFNKQEQCILGIICRVFSSKIYKDG